MLYFITAIAPYSDNNIRDSILMYQDDWLVFYAAERDQYYLRDFWL
jgi:hypothetical protein